MFTNSYHLFVVSYLIGAQSLERYKQPRCAAGKKASMMCVFLYRDLPSNQKNWVKKGGSAMDERPLSAVARGAISVTLSCHSIYAVGSP